jgi:hypothetical protein
MILPKNDDWEKRYNKGETIVDIAKADQVSRWDVWQELKRLGLFKEQRRFHPNSIRNKNGRVNS